MASYQFSALRFMLLKSTAARSWNRLSGTLSSAAIWPGKPSILDWPKARKTQKFGSAPSLGVGGMTGLGLAAGAVVAGAAAFSPELFAPAAGAAVELTALK